MEKYWRPGLRVWWRSKGEAQLGLDPPTILFGLSPDDHELLTALAHADPQLDCWTVAMRLGWSREAYTAFVRRLPDHALVDSPTRAASPTHRYWSLMEAAGSPYSTARFSSQIIVDGVDALGIQLADAVSTAGIGALFLHDPRPVLPHDLHPGGFHTDDVGRVRDHSAVNRLRLRHPLAALHLARKPHVPPPETDPGRAQNAAQTGSVYAPALRGAHPESCDHPDFPVDLAVLIAHGALAPRRARPYMLRGIPLLPVVVRELDIMIGPLLAPPGPCLRCLHLTATDDDPCWPALATQLASETNAGIDPLVIHLAAGVAAHQVVAIADKRPAGVAGVSLHVDGLHPVPRYQTWQPHPKCGCDLGHLVA